MRRTMLIALLSLGTVGGFAAGCHSLARHHLATRDGSCAWEGPLTGRGSARSFFEDHVASVCVAAARRSDLREASDARAGARTAPGNREAGAETGATQLGSDRAAAAADRAAAAAERAAAAAERAAARVERASLDPATQTDRPPEGSAAASAPQ